MIQAVATARVPKFTVVAGSFGAGNYGMCGRGRSSLHSSGRRHEPR